MQALTVKPQNVCTIKNADAKQERSAWKAAAPVNVGTRSVQAFSADRYDKQEADAAGIRLLMYKSCTWSAGSKGFPGLTKRIAGLYNKQYVLLEKKGGYHEKSGKERE